MPPKPTAGKKPPYAAAAAAGDVRLLQDLETLSKALSIDPKRLPPSRSISAGRSNPNPKSHDSSSSSSSKKAPFWKSWKPLRALSHIRSRRFDCRFSLHVHSVDGLPQPFSGSSLVVRWKRTTDPSGSSSATRPVRVFGSSAEFEEVLSYRCSVYGTRSGSTGAAKYEPRHFLIWVTVLDSPGTDLGRNLVDLTRLLPLTLEELEEEEKSSGKWSTSFKLSGKGKGSSISVSFGFSLDGFGDGSRSRASRSQSVENVKVLHEVLQSSRSEVSAVAAKAEFEGSVGLLSPDLKKTCNTEVESAKAKLEGSGGPLSSGLKTCNSEEVEVVKGDEEKDCEDPEFLVIEQGMEMDSKDPILEPKLEKVQFEIGEEKEKDEFEIREETEMVNLEKIEVDSGRVDEGDAIGEHEVEKVDEGAEETSNGNRLSKGQEMEDLEAEFRSLPVVDWEKLESPEVESITPRRMSYGEVKSSYKAGGPMSKSLSLDDETVASEFLSMLGIDHSPFGFSSDSDPESPRERLLKQFERESLNTSTGLFGVDIGSPKEPDWPDADFAEDFDLSMIVHEAETEFQMEMEMGMETETRAMDSKSRAKLMEDAETEALMRQYGIDEKVFQGSPPAKRSGFGSPIDLPPEEPLELPPLCEGLGPFVQTKDGGFLRSMSPSLFKNAKNNGHLIMQVSSPVVVPAEMGSGIMEILGRLASVGIEKLSMQAKKLMPLEEITGKTMQQIAWEAAPALEACERQDQLHHLKASIESAVGQVASRGSKRGRSPNHASSGAGEMASEYVSIEDLAPLAMDKIEALSVEGLRIQSGMSDEEAPSNISPQSIGEISALEGKQAVNSMALGMEGTGGLQLLDVKDSGDVVDGLMGLSITLDEWMRLDSGIVHEEDEISDRTSKVLAAHHARATDMITGGSKRGGRRSGKRWGLLGNNFTVALMVQLRDPLRNYEPVGTPMLSLIQVERVFVPPKPKIYNTVSEKGNFEEQDDEPETKTELETNKEKKEKEEEEEDNIPQFKITEVHITGLKTEPGKKKPWGNPVQQQSGSRWLLATGMGKSNKHPFMKSKPASKSSPVTATVQPGDSLWSISSRVHGNGSKWKELLAVNPHVRNPNVILPNETIRLK